MSSGRLPKDIKDVILVLVGGDDGVGPFWVTFGTIFAYLRLPLTAQRILKRYLNQHGWADVDWELEEHKQFESCIEDEIGVMNCMLVPKDQPSTSVWTLPCCNKGYTNLLPGVTNSHKRHQVYSVEFWLWVLAWYIWAFCPNNWFWTAIASSLTIIWWVLLDAGSPAGERLWANYGRSSTKRAIGGGDAVFAVGERPYGRVAMVRWCMRFSTK